MVQDINEQYTVLINYITKLLGERPTEKAIRQINKYVREYGYTYQGIMYSLIWYYEIEKNSISMANHGIGIVPYVYNDAKDYYERVYKANKINSDIDNYNCFYGEEEVVISRPKSKTKNEKKFFNLD